MYDSHIGHNIHRLTTALGSRLSSAEAAQLLVEVEGVRSEGGNQLRTRLCELADHSPQDQVTAVQGEELRPDDAIHPLTQVSVTSK